jgi:hypothetical protein
MFSIQPPNGAFVIPEAKIQEDSMLIPGTNGGK